MEEVGVPELEGVILDVPVPELDGVIEAVIEPV